MNPRQLIYNLLRPVYRPVIRVLRQRLGRNYFEHPEMELPPPYEAVQLDVERNLNKWLHVAPDKISQIVIVGACEADEVGRMHHCYPKAAFLCFEPNPNTFQLLTEKFHAAKHVTLSKLAVSDAPGKARFYEPSMPGNGSLLEPDIESWLAVNQREDKSMTSFEVEMSTLDQEAAQLLDIDLLWMDVQGAEGRVLTGAAKTLKRTKAIFLEVALFRSPYKGAELFAEITTRLEAEGFTCVGLGLDAWNGTGNAFFVKQFQNLICIQPPW